jgi:hypothetical protein
MFKKLEIQDLLKSHFHFLIFSLAVHSHALSVTFPCSEMDFHNDMKQLAKLQITVLTL